MKGKNISFELQSRVRRYLKYIDNKDVSNSQESEVLEKLTKTLKNEVILQAHGKILSQITLLTENFTQKTMNSLAYSMKYLTFSPDEFIYKVDKIIIKSLII